MYLRRWGFGIGRLHVTWLDLWAHTQWHGDAKNPWWRGLGLWVEWGKG